MYYFVAENQELVGCGGGVHIFDPKNLIDHDHPPDNSTTSLAPLVNKLYININSNN